MRHALLLALLLASSCQKDTVTLPPGNAAEGNRMTQLVPGPETPVRAMINPLPATEDTLAEGKRLYNQFNCSGCHAAGGGAIGPPLMDDLWIYGSTPANIYWTIVEGRPQGMPAFGGKIVDKQIWQIVAYVRSLSKLPEDPKANKS